MSRRPASPSWRLLAVRVAVALLLGAAAGCRGPKILRDPVYTSDNIRIQLRRTLEKGQPVSRSYAHPATVSDVRLAHVLANIEHEDKNGKRLPTIASELVYELAEQLNKAALKATPDDEIAAVLFTETARLGVFKDRRVTSFRMYFTSDALVFDFYDVARPLEAQEGRPGREDYQIPINEPVASSAFKLLPGQGQETAGRQTLKVDWRDPYFSKPIALSVREGRFKRRTVISESAAPADTEPDAPAPTLGSDPARRDAQLRALDQLDAARRSGLVTEQEFQKRRRLILEGKLEEAGYGSTP